MPGIPDHRVLNDASARGTAFVLHSYSLDAGGVSYAVQTALYPADVDVSQSRAILQTALDDRAKRLEGGKWSATHWQNIDGSPGVESLGALGGGRGLRQIMVLKGRRYVALAFLGSADSIRSPDADRFFKSLRLK
jgi:hypothetical protein